jgi:hypothetical protein
VLLETMAIDNAVSGVAVSFDDCARRRESDHQSNLSFARCKTHEPLHALIRNQKISYIERLTCQDP